MVPPERRASAIGLVVWAATIGSVIGPWLVPVASDLALSVGLPPLAGPYLVPIVFVGLAALLSFAMLRPDPFDLADESTRADPASEPAVIAPVRVILRRPAVAAAIVALVVGQFVMVLVMTMTPLHMTEHGHDLAAVGLVLSVHTLGMFAFSPLSGWLSDRFGRVPTIFLGTATLAVASVMAALAPPDGGFQLTLAMFLLGLGWSFGFVAGSAMLSENLEIHERTRVQGVADALIWSTAAAASLGSGLIMAAVGYTALGILGAGAVIIPVIVLRAHRRRDGTRGDGGSRRRGRGDTGTTALTGDAANEDMTERKDGTPATVTTSVVDPAAWDPRTVSGSRYDAVLFADVDMSDFEDRGASFSACTFRGIRFNASTHVDAAFTNCTFVGCNFFDVRFTGCKLVGSVFDRCAFDLLAVEGGDWSLAGLRGADLRKATFHGVRMREADLAGARFEGATVRDTDLSGAWLRGASFHGADLRGSDLSALDPLLCDVVDALIDVEQAMVIAAALGLRIG